MEKSKNEKNIIKVQISIVSNSGPNILMYNKDRSVFFQTVATEEFKELMGNQLKKYFNSELVSDGNDGHIIKIGKEATEKEWESV